MTTPTPGPVVLPRPAPGGILRRLRRRYAALRRALQREALEAAAAAVLEDEGEIPELPDGRAAFGLQDGDEIVTPLGAAFLVALATELPAQFPTLLVTSGRRTPRQQAGAMAYKLTRGDDLLQLYRARALVLEIVAAAGDRTAPNVARMAEVIEGQVARGLYISSHLAADALDLRRRHYSAEQLDAVVAAARNLGARVVLEPDHIHVEHIPPHLLQE